MVKVKISKRALWSSGISLFLSFLMLMGTTFAWFSDTAYNKGNKIQAGNLKVQFLASDTGEFAIDNQFIQGEFQNPSELEQVADLKNYNFPIFNFPDVAQPGDTITRYLRIKNIGSIDLKYDLDFIVTEDSILADAIQFDIQKIATSQLPLSTYTGNTIDADTYISGTLTANSAPDIYMVTMRFDPSAGNTYNLDTANLTFSVDVILTATQLSGNLKRIKSISDLDNANIAPNDSLILMRDITAENTDVAIDKLVNIDLNGYSLKIKSFSIASNSYGTVDIANGNIEATSAAGSTNYGIYIDLPNATFNIKNLTFAVAAGKQIYVRTSPNTFNIGANVVFISGEEDGPIVIGPNTRVVIAAGVSVEEIIILSGSTGVVIENNGTIGNINNQSGGFVTVHNGSDGQVNGYSGDVELIDAEGYIALDMNYFGPLAEQNFAVRVAAGKAKMEFPKIDPYLGWSFKGSYLQFNKRDFNYSTAKLYAPIGIKADALLAKYPGYSVKSATVNGISNWYNSKPADAQNGYTKIMTSQVAANKTGSNSLVYSDWSITPAKHILLITLAKPGSADKVFKLEVEIIEKAPLYSLDFSSGKGDWSSGEAKNNVFIPVKGSNSKYGGYRSEWSGGWVAEIDIKISMSKPNGSYFQITTASNKADNNHLRDFVFSMKKINGVYKVNATNGTDGYDWDGWYAGSNLLTSINKSGWYTLRWNFYNKNNALACDMQIINRETSQVIATKTLTNPSDSISTVGLNRYIWVTNVNGSFELDNQLLLSK